MGDAMLFPTSAKRVAILLSCLGFVFLLVCLGICVYKTYSSLRYFVFWNVPDAQYEAEFKKEFGDPRFLRRMCNWGDCVWPTTTRLPTKYKAELSALLEEIKAIKVGGCQEVDFAFSERSKQTKSVSTNAKESLYGSAILLKKNPSYEGIEELKALVSCYRECNCPKDNLFLLRRSLSDAVLLKDTKYFAQAFWSEFPSRARAVGRSYYVKEVATLATFLLAFACGLFDPVLRVFSKLFSWIKTGK